MTTLTPYLRAFAIELAMPTDDKSLKYQWPAYTDGDYVPKAYFRRFGIDREKVLAVDLLFCAKLFYPWNDSSGKVYEVIERLEKLGWVPTIVEIVAATDLPERKPS